MDEREYFRFLEELSNTNGVLVSVATDAGLNKGAKESQDVQVRAIRDAVEGLPTPDRKAEAEALAAAMEKLSLQQYVEIICRMCMAFLAVNVGVSHYVQIEPQTLGRMDWQIDRKGGAGDAFERAHGPLMAGLASAMSEKNPMPFLPWGDYSHFGRFIRGGVGALRPTSSTQSPAQVRINPQRLYRENQRFVDSKKNRGVQIADLLVSGLGALLRGKFHDQARAARCLGRLTKRLYATDKAIDLTAFTPGTDSAITDVAKTAIKEMNMEAGAVFVQRAAH